MSGDILADPEVAIGLGDSIPLVQGGVNKRSLGQRFRNLVHPGIGQCQLTKSSANLLLLPKDGNLLTINGVACVVPDAGITLAPTSLAAATFYYIYATASGAA